MSVTRSASGVILLKGDCPIEEAEVLLRYLSADRTAPVDWSACEQAHTAVIQVLMAVQRRILGAPKNAFLRAHVALGMQRAVVQLL